MSHIVVITTCADEDQAQVLAQTLVAKKLAACVQATGIFSTYRWRDAVETAREVRLMIKAKRTDYPAIETCIKSMHSYEIPEIIALPVVAGSAAYLDWIDAETNRLKADGQGADDIGV